MLTTAAPAAFAQPFGGGGADASTDGGSDGGSEADALIVEIDRDWGSLQSADCDTACRALDSMRRAADRLCVLEPGDRCTRAQQRVKDATERVRSTCPACASVQQGEKAATPPGPAPAEREEAAAPGRAGGCAGCTLAERDDARGGLGAAMLAAVGLALLRRRRK
jgi:MYXO-CTERM domain-containing protein